jgi:hypothetical protein
LDIAYARENKGYESLLFYMIKAREEHGREEFLLFCGFYYKYLIDHGHFRVLLVVQKVIVRRS